MQTRSTVLTVTLNPALDVILRVDRLALHATNVVGRKETYAGGKGFNVAKALAAQAIPVTAVGLVGAAEVPFYRAALEPRGIALSLVTAAATRSNLKIIETASGAETELNEPGSPVPDTTLAELRRVFARLLPGTSWVVFAGRGAPGVAPALLGELAGQATAAGAAVLLDTTEAWLGAGLAAHPACVRLNLAELGAWAGRPLASLDAAPPAARALLAAGIGTVVVSHGPAGVLLLTANGTWVAHPPRLHAINAVGAGDAMSAGLIAAALRGLPPPEALRWAVAVAAASVLTPEPGVLDPAVATDLATRVTIDAPSPPV